MPIPDHGELYAIYESQLQQSHRGLPIRFRAELKRLLKHLTELFAEDWPLVPNHTDLLENNIPVSPETGSITGICDWKDATVSPFGTSIEGLVCLLGERTMKGWRWLPDHINLRRQFWHAFYAAMGSHTAELEQRIDTARLVGIFLTHGLVWVMLRAGRPSWRDRPWVTSRRLPWDLKRFWGIDIIPPCPDDGTTRVSRARNADRSAIS